MKFRVFKYKNGQWGWSLVAANGEIIASGEGYKNKRDCLAVIDLVRTSGEADIEKLG